METSYDRAGYGGHTDVCKGVGQHTLQECQELMKSTPTCNAATHKHGNCWLHDRATADHWAGDSEQSLYLSLLDWRVDACAE